MSRTALPSPAFRRNAAAAVRASRHGARFHGARFHGARFHGARRLALAFALALATTAGAGLAEAEDAMPRPRRDVGQFALYGRSYVRWDGAAAMPARAGVASEALVEFPSRTPMDGDEGFVAAPVVVARDGSSLHAVFADTLETDDDVALAHPLQPFPSPMVADVDWPKARAVECGGADVTVDAANSPLVLAPGRYGVVTVMQDRELRLVAGGRYELCSLRARPGATVVAPGGTFVLVRDHVTTGARARITGSGACGARWIAMAETPSPAPASAGFEFAHGTGASNRALIQGDFFTPGRIAMAQHNDYTGRFWADRIDGFGAEEATRTLGDCQAPRCGDGSLDPGEGCDDGNNRDGDCCSAFCEVAPAGAACDDGLFCTVTDTCDASGACRGWASPCDAPDGDANCREACNEDTDACDAPDPEASPCDDGLWCNGDDLCAGGLCGAHAGSPCPGADDDANCRESCDEATRSCTAADPVGVACSDGRYCTVGETCGADGQCGGGRSPCPEGDGDEDCTEACDELADSCTALDREGSACDDGLFCTASDRCDGRGRCLGAGSPCTGAVGDGDRNCSEACDESSGACSAPDPDGAPCDDGLACTVGERCLGGACAATGTTSCDDGNPCTDEFCAPDGQCLRDYNHAPCDDGNACTTGDRCLRGSCAGSATVSCDDGDLCSTDSCDPADGTCRHSYTPMHTCHTLGSGRTRVELGYAAGSDRLTGSLVTSWTGEHGLDPTLREEVGDVSGGEPFAVCFYDESGALPELAWRFDFDAATTAGATWKRTWREADASWRLKAPAGTTQGVSVLRLRVDKVGSPAFKLKAGDDGRCEGPCLDKFAVPPPRADGRLFAMEPAMTVQWRASTGACWSSRYEEASQNSDEGFKARARSR